MNPRTSIVSCRVCGEGYLDDGSDTPAAYAFRDTHGSNCNRTPVEASQVDNLRMLEALANMPATVSH